MVQNQSQFFSRKLNLFAEKIFNLDVMVENQLEIDTDIQNLSSRKLWQILQLNDIPGCELDQGFLNEVKKELMLRNDYDNGVAWNEPH